MQTFLPYPNISDSVRCLDNKRLMNQRNEAYIICEHIFPLGIKCKTCWDLGGIPACLTCGKTTVPTCFKCRDKGMIPACPTCGTEYNSTGSVVTGWANHPAVQMWKPWRWALLCYSFAVCREVKRRGFSDSVHKKLLKFGNELIILPDELYPIWFGDPAFHASHRSNLLRKNFEWYSAFGWTESKDLPYVWPK